MTTETKDKIKGWLWAINLSLLSFIAAGMGWLLVTMNGRVESNQTDIIELKIITYNLATAYTEHQKNDDKLWQSLEQWKAAMSQEMNKRKEEYMELWKLQRRGSGTDMTKYK